MRMLRRWQARRQAERKANEQTERILCAFVAGDVETINTEIARRYGRMFALLAQMPRLDGDA